MHIDDAVYLPDPLPTSDLVIVVDRTALIEKLMNQVILTYCSPRQDARPFMWSIVLDTSVMSIGAKAKVVMAVAQEMNFTLARDAIHKVIELRNAFAHHATDANFKIGSDALGETTVYHEFWILRGSGRLDKKRRNEAFDEFNHAFDKARVSLVELASLTTKYLS